jgi:hypothetical protein
VWTANEPGRCLDQPIGQTGISNQSGQSSRVAAKNPMDAVRAGAPWCVQVSARLASTSSITAGMKEEHQIRITTGFGVERNRIRVEGDRTRV